MITNDAVKETLLLNKEVKLAEVTGDGYHFHVTLVGSMFEGLSKLKRQQWVYSKLNAYITSGELHALTMTTLTEQEWEKNNG